MNARSTLLSAAILGATGVALGAFGAHVLQPFLVEHGMLNAWETAVRYQLVQAVALAALAAWQRQDNAAAAGFVARCWTIGVGLFSGSLYGIALGGPRWLGPVTPLGGAALIVGWCGLIAVARKTPGPR